MATAAKHQQQQNPVVCSVSVSSSSTSSSCLPNLVPLQRQQQNSQNIGEHHQHIPKIHPIHRSTSPTDNKSSPTSPGIASPGGVGTLKGHFLLRSTTKPHNQHNPQFVKPIESDEEVESIAKQISDHAEAIYQTWKARGLAPTEILNCHTSREAGAQFGKTLTPPNIRNNLESPVAEFLSNTTPDMSNNNLEKLVSSFVNEDKARQHAARKNSLPSVSSAGQNVPISNNSTSILTSGTIRDVLKKFESSNSSNDGNLSVGYIKPNFLINKGYATSKHQQVSNLQSLPVNNIIASTNTSAIEDVPKVQTNLKSPTSQLNKNVPDVLIDTINSQQQQKQLKSQKNFTSIISGSVGLTKKQLQQQNNKNSSNSVPVLIGGRISPTTQSTNKTISSNLDDIDSKINPSISNKSNNIVLVNSNTTSITSNLSTSKIKPQTPVKPANLLNHQPVWPNKNRNVPAGGGSTPSPINATKNLNSPTATATTSSATIKTESYTNSTATTPIDTSSNTRNGSSSGSNNTSSSSHSLSNIRSNSKLVKQTEEINSTVGNSNNIGDLEKLSPSITASIKKSSDLLEEVTREEERLINALKTGIILNNNHNNYNNKNNNNLITNNNKNASLPEVIQSTLNESNKIIKVNSNLSGKHSSSALNNQKKSLKSTIPTSSDQQKKLKTVTNNLTNLLSAEIKICTKDDKKVQMDVIQSAVTNDSNSISTIIAQSLPSGSGPSPAAPKDIILSTPSIKTTMRPKNNAAVPHPEQKSGTISLHSNYTNSRTNNTTLNPVRPFLTRGSVAERVMMFEKCPDVKAPMRNINREPPRAPKLHAVPKPEPQSHTTLQRAVRSSNPKNVYIPRFHYPHGKPIPNIAQETIIQRVKCTFDSFPNNQVSKDDFPQILKICGLPHYWRMPFMACTQIMASNLIDGYRFVDFWKQMSVYCHDIESRFVYILSRGQRSRPYILPEDLAPLVQDVVDNHPGLAFLKEASEFHSRYVHTVIARIFYSVNRSWSGRITVAELRRSNLIQVIQLLEEEEDINQIMAFFSYEHFYVIYCKFWELDRDHDLFIDQNDLARHNDHALSTRIIERIFSGCVTRGGKSRIIGPNGPKISYTEFVWFLLSEEDKTNPTSIEYWFRCMDLDGDGIISMYELEYFYEEQQQRMESIGIETLPFEDCLCQMLDMIKPAKLGCVTLTDLKRCKMTAIFFDTFFNLEKYLEHEQRDPFANQRDNDEMSDWDRYAAQEYELLVAEEGGDTQGSFEEEDDDYESNIDVLETQIDDMSNMINEW